MDDTTIRRLNAINREFYRVTVDNFDESRGRFWQGWDRLARFISPKKSTLRVLDLGCGNGRFGRFLGKTFASSQIDYHGIDNNPILLSRASEDLDSFSNIRVTLEESDIVDSPPTQGEFDLVVLLGVIHHIPGLEFRKQLIQQIADRVLPTGLLCITSWCFYEFERFRAKCIPFSAELFPNLTPERGDYLMDWRRGHDANSILRYCHYVDEAEQDALVTASRLREITRFRADGHTNDINRYSICAGSNYSLDHLVEFDTIPSTTL